LLERVKNEIIEIIEIPQIFTKVLCLLPTLGINSPYFILYKRLNLGEVVQNTPMINQTFLTDLTQLDQDSEEAHKHCRAFLRVSYGNV